MRLWRFKSWSTILETGKTLLTQDDVLAEDSIEMNQAVPPSDEQGDVTSIEWNQDGTLLASGCFDGTVRIWSVEGTVLLHERQHSVSCRMYLPLSVSYLIGSHFFGEIRYRWTLAPYRRI
jgi:WD40 repeat protein